MMFVTLLCWQRAGWPVALLTLLTIALVMRAKLNPVWLIAAGAIVGIAGIL